MRTPIAGSILLLVTTLAATQAVFGQDTPAYDARNGVTLMRAINTAENAQRRSGGYAPLEQLVSHPMMGKVAPNVVINGSGATYLGQTVRLLVSNDGQHYQAALVPPSGCGIAFFSDERGLIFSGKVLDCP